MATLANSAMEEAVAPSTRSPPNLRLIRRAAIVLFAVLCLITGASRTAIAGWVPEGGGPDFGGNLQGALHYAWYVNGWGTVPFPQDKGQYLSGNVGNICGTEFFGATVCNFATLSCDPDQLASKDGCLTQLNGYPRYGKCTDPSHPAAPVGDPIDPLTGNLSERAVDFATASGPTLSAIRYYNNVTPYQIALGSQGYSRFGWGWRSEYDRKLIFTYGGGSPTAVDVLTADGNPLHFVLSGGGWALSHWDFSSNAWTTPRNDCYYTLTTDGTYWYLANNKDTVDKYNNSGVLQTISYRGGYVQTLTYDGSGNNTVVSDSLGRSITFAYSASGLATSLTDPDGNVTTYTFVDRSGSTDPTLYVTLAVLQTVTYPATSGTPALTYLYEDSAYPNLLALTGIVDENGNRYETSSYDSTTGRLLSTSLAGGANQINISYDDTGNTRTVTNALGKEFIYNTNNFQDVLQIASIAGQASTHTAASTISYLYDSNGYVSQVTDGNGNVTTYVHNATGQETSRTEGYGSAVARTITTTWDATWREPDQIVQPNLTTNFTYDSSGRLTQLTQTDTTTETVPYSTNGQTRTWTYTYYTTSGLVGLLDTVTGPLSGETTSYTYNSSGFVNSVTDPLSHVTNITSTNGRGQPLTSVDPNGVTTNYTYDPRGRILSITVNPGATQSQFSFTYDLAESLTEITLPDSATLIYAYDHAHRLTSITNNLGESITYTLDALGDRIARVVKSATGTITKEQTATFDELGRVMANIGAAAQTTSYTYDLDNNQITTIDPRGKIYGHAFDALNRLYQQTDPDLYTTTTAFNAQDRPISVTDARSLLTTYVRDGFGDLIQQTSPDTDRTVFWYDGNGAVVKKIDARNVETDYTNDVTGRVLTKNFPSDAAENVTYTYDSTSGGNFGIGRLTSVTDQSGSTAFVYDALGRVVTDARVVSGNSYSTAYTYDPAGNILTETYPSGRIVTYTRDALGRIAGITTQQNGGAPVYNVASSVGYEPFGPLSGLTFGNGIAATHTYDQDYQLTAITAAGGAVQNLTNTYDPNSNITAITDGFLPNRSQTFTYDDLNRLASANGAYGPQTYSYDGVGNRLTRVVGGTTETYAYSPSANQIASITSTGPTADNEIAATYLYNAFEQRVQKTVGSATTQFVFDRFGHLLAEENASGVVQKEYLWLDDLPVDLVDDTVASPALYFIHTDHIGSPQKITNAAAQVVWDGTFDPFGNASTSNSGVWGTSVWGDFSWSNASSGGNWNTAVWDSFSWVYRAGVGVWGESLWGSFAWNAPLSISNLRFPGQYADAESGLNQNWFRDYSPAIGRYIQGDPVGLASGPNLYVYVNNGPLDSIDSTGLCPPTRYCQLPDGTIVAYTDLGDGLAAIGAAIGQAGAETQAPTLDKPGGIAGGGPSGPYTSPASQILRQVIPGRSPSLVNLTGTASVGGSLARTIPFLGAALGLFDFIEFMNAPACVPIT